MRVSDADMVKAIEALTWLIGDEDVLLPFLSMTGASIDDVKAGAGQPQFLGAALDFILTNDDWVLACAQNLDISPESLMSIRSKLPGGEVVRWT